MHTGRTDVGGAAQVGSQLIMLAWGIWVAFALYGWWTWPPRDEGAMGLAIILLVVVVVGWAMNFIGMLVLGFALKGSNRTRGNIAIFWIGVLGIAAPVLMGLPELWK
jgi:hypothetical protein